MKISSLSIDNLKSFPDEQTFEFSPKVNLFVGANNSGKSTVLWCLYLLQQMGDPNGQNARFRLSRRDHNRKITLTYAFGDADTRIAALDKRFVSGELKPVLRLTYPGARTEGPEFSGMPSMVETFTMPLEPRLFPDQEPHNLFYYFLSRRRATEFKQIVNLTTAGYIADNFIHINAKVAKLSNSSHPKHGVFVELCNSVLGFPIGTGMTEQGQEAGFVMPDYSYIPLNMMGDGTVNIIGLLADLALANRHVFLIEEPENEIHPRALSALLDLIARKSDDNQFFVTTHSDFVLRKLGASEHTAVFRHDFALEEGRPTSRAARVPAQPAPRLQLLRELGHGLSDSLLREGYLLFDEDPAEGLVSRLLIPFFVPELSGLVRTHSAGGIEALPGDFEELHQLVGFLYQTPAHRGRCFVRVGGDEGGVNAIKGLREKLGDAGPLQLKNYSRPMIENYLPDRFSTDVADALGKKDPELRRRIRLDLCRDVTDWAHENPEVARRELAVSARELIDDLQEICAYLESQVQ